MAESGVVPPWETHVDRTASPHTPAARATLQISHIGFISAPRLERLNNHTFVTGQGRVEYEPGGEGGGA